MGLPFNELLAPAVLLDNPGVTREEFARLMGALKPAMQSEYATDSLHTLAEILRLPYSQNYLAHVDAMENKEVGYSHEEFFSRCVHKDDEVGTKPCIVRLKHRVGKETSDTSYLPEIPKPGFTTDHYGFHIYIREVLDAKFEGPDEDSDPGDKGGYMVEWKGNRVQFSSRHINVRSLDHLLTRYPLYHPDAMFDWSQTEGQLVPDWPSKRCPQFRWYMRGGKYSLDMDFLRQHTPAIRNVRDDLWAYTDLILTAEAIRTQSWWALDYLHAGHPMADFMVHGEEARLATDFLKEFPASKARYDQAVRDSHLGLFGKGQKYTESDLMRLRLLGGATTLDKSRRVEVDDGEL